MSEIFLTLPSVPTLNHVYRNVRINHRVTSERLKQHWQPSHAEKLVMEVTIFWPDHRRRDADNCLKLLSDTLEGVLYEDDRWVLPRVVDFFVDKQNPRVEVRIFKLNSNGGAHV